MNEGKYFERCLFKNYFLRSVLCSFVRLWIDVVVFQNEWDETYILCKFANHSLDFANNSHKISVLFNRYSWCFSVQRVNGLKLTIHACIISFTWYSAYVNNSSEDSTWLTPLLSPLSCWCGVLSLVLIIQDWKHNYYF